MTEHIYKAIVLLLVMFFAWAGGIMFHRSQITQGAIRKEDIFMTVLLFCTCAALFVVAVIFL